jgi:hypothetical protein
MAPVRHGIRAVQARVHEVRYERLSADPAGVAAELAASADAAGRPLATTLTAVHSWLTRSSRTCSRRVGVSWRELGYLQSV